MTERNSPYEPMLEADMRRMIEERFGREIRCSADCERLAADIEARTRQHVGATSVKRWFGFAGDGTSNIRRSTRDIMAQFLGYKGYRELRWKLGDEYVSSAYVPSGDISVSNLKSGDMVRLTWDPGRDVEMEYLGDCRFIITKSVNSKLQVDDIVRIAGFRKGTILNVLGITRLGMEMGAYEGAKINGLTSVEVF